MVEKQTVTLVNYKRFSVIALIATTLVVVVKLLTIMFSFKIPSLIYFAAPLIPAMDAGQRYYDEYEVCPPIKRAWLSSLLMTLIHIATVVPIVVFSDIFHSYGFFADASAVEVYSVLIAHIRWSIFTIPLSYGLILLAFVLGPWFVQNYILRTRI